MRGRQTTSRGWSRSGRQATDIGQSLGNSQSRCSQRRQGLGVQQGPREAARSWLVFSSEETSTYFLAFERF
ncbi:Group 3 Secretory Phospholipase A2 [Manis pentadactyla]|nr:Group 3 Secretory Phospholipase A2 [Manis pentadactyla]